MLPLARTTKRLAAPLFVFIFGMKCSCFSSVTLGVSCHKRQESLTAQKSLVLKNNTRTGIHVKSFREVRLFPAFNRNCGNRLFGPCGHQGYAEPESGDVSVPLVRFCMGSFGFPVFTPFFRGDSTITICLPSIRGNCSTVA